MGFVVTEALAIASTTLGPETTLPKTLRKNQMKNWLVAELGSRILA
jgi:hypothetical protein